MSKPPKKPPLSPEAIEWFRQMGRKGGKKGARKGGLAAAAKMTKAARIARAKKAGMASGGRPPVVDQDKVVKLRWAGASVKEIAAQMHCSVATVYRILRVRKGRHGS